MFDNNNKAGGAAGLPSFHQASVAAVAMTSRERFYVELKPGETTFVSWKKLLKDSQKAAWAPSPSSEAPTGAHPALEARIAPEVVKSKDSLPPPPNRFNSVIERIERLYQGGNSDNELSDCLDDDKYDTRDSFIDDAELDDYFSVEDAKLKHEGFFVNRGKLEQETELSPSTIAGLKKRKRKDLKNLSTESDENVSNKLKSGVRLKAAARKVPTPSSGLPSGFDLNSSIQKERKEAPYPLFGQGTGKGTAGMVVESDLVNSRANSTVVSGCSKNVARDKTDGKELSKGIAVDRPMLDHMCRVNAMEQAIVLFDVNEPLERDAIVQLEKRETPTINGTKAKRAMKDDDLKETLVGAKKPPPLAAKEVSPGRAKGTVLERAFLDLEKGVAELCPPSLAVREPEQGKRNRLPRDIKQKLAKVARLAAKQGRMTDELIERLMGILGHVVRVKTLKRNLKAMIEMGLSAMQEKEGRLQGIKKEVTEMIKSRVHKLQAQDVSQLDDFQLLGTPSEKASGEGRYQWDHETEDKICDLYEQYIEGMDENKGPHLRKFYAELAELWPDGWMDNIGIKLAVHRAKERKERQRKASNSGDAKKRRRPVVKPKIEDLGGGGEMILQLITGGGHDQSPYEKMSSTTCEHEVCLGHGHEERLSTEEEKKHTMKPGSMERKSKAADGGPPLKKKVKREVDKCGVAASDRALVALNKSFSTQDAFVGSTVASIPPSETPPWSMVTHHSFGAAPPLNE